jgi:putative phosphoribosyl transferase
MEGFDDRVDAGRHLARRLEHLRGEDVVVLGLPRGGVPVASEVATALGAPMDVIVVRKLGLPRQPELAMGAIGEGGFEVLDRDLIARAGVDAGRLRDVEDRERDSLDARVARFRRGRERIDIAGRAAVIVDDGLATGATARVACAVARHLGAARVVLAVPVAPRETLDAMEDADEVVCVSTPPEFRAVGHHYRDFTPTTDEEVVAHLRAAADPTPKGPEGTPAGPDGGDVDIRAGNVVLQGHLELPEDPRGMVVFAHGSGSSRHSVRNRYVASALREAGLGTLLPDLLTADEEQDRAHVFDIALLADRLAAAVRWLRQRPEVSSSRIGLFGASTGAAAALWAAADTDLDIAAVVSRGGRPDLAEDRLTQVTAPTLLIVGGADTTVRQLNRDAQSRLQCPSRLSVVPHATHLFEEPGALEKVAELASGWFGDHLSAAEPSEWAGSSEVSR